MSTFSGLGLSDVMLSSLEKLNFTEPTEIQSKTLPIALSGRNILGISQTGTGKTAAFGIPLIEHLLKNPSSTALVITPTRELAKQVEGVLISLTAKESNLRTALLVGGDSIVKQLQRLKRKNQIIVGTPGRINDHLRRKSISLKNIDYVVLDEADRMLDEGFSVQIEQIIQGTPENRQMLLFSATMSHSVQHLADQYLKDADRISVQTKHVISDKIEQKKVFISEGEKQARLIEEISSRPGSILVFVKTKRKAEKVAFALKKAKEEADAIHGDIRQNKRERIMRSFRNNRFRVLVATDLAARGLDVPHIGHVINYDLPTSPEDYIHRIGRTGRAGRTGESLCFIAPSDEKLWRAIQILLDPTKKPARIKSGLGNKSKFKGRGGKSFSRDRSSNEQRQKPSRRSDNSSRFEASSDRPNRFKKRTSDDTSQTKGNGSRFESSSDRPNRFKKRTSDDTSRSKGNGSRFESSSDRPNSFKKRTSDDTSRSKGNGSRFESSSDRPNRFKKRTSDDTSRSKGNGSRFESSSDRPNSFKKRTSAGSSPSRENSSRYDAGSERPNRFKNKTSGNSTNENERGSRFESGAEKPKRFKKSFDSQRSESPSNKKKSFKGNSGNSHNRADKPSSNSTERKSGKKRFLDLKKPSGGFKFAKRKGPNTSKHKSV